MATPRPTCCAGPTWRFTRPSARAADAWFSIAHGLTRTCSFAPSLAQDLRQAIELGQLEAHYQPQVNIQTGEVDGFESLLRWNHPVHGHVSPAKFIPIAESNGLICSLGHWILRESCRQAKAWIDEGFDIRKMSVNVSIAQIRQARI